MTALPNLQDFQSHLNEIFSVALSDGTDYPLTLIEVGALPPSHTHLTRQDPFQVKFRGPGPGYLPQQIHALDNATLGHLDVFLVPIGQLPDGFLYQAVFN